MKNLLWVIVTSAVLFAGCGDDSKKSSGSACQPNATMGMAITTSYLDVELNSDQQIEFSGLKPSAESEATYVRLKSGEEVSFGDNEIDPEPDDSVIDFGKMTFTSEDSDGNPLTISILRDEVASKEKGLDTFVLKDSEVKNSILTPQFMAQSKEDGVEICSVPKAKGSFEFDQDAKTFKGLTEVIFEVRLEKDALEFVKEHSQ